MVRFDSLADLTNPARLMPLFGPISKINTTLLSPASGCSGSLFQRLEGELHAGTKRSFILKSTRLKTDWLTQRAGDHHGREAFLLGEPRLLKIWDCIHCTYIAFAADQDQIGLLMDDFSDHLFPDHREPIDLKKEDLIVQATASLHAAFWESILVKQIGWLAKPVDYLDLFAPAAHPTDQYAPVHSVIGNAMRTGWEIALHLLPPAIIPWLTRPAEEIFEPYRSLPFTLIHGDLKIANMAVLPAGDVVMFDWPVIGYAPCGIDIGWYLAVNSTRLARTKEEFLEKYRSSLESHLRNSIAGETWLKMMELAIISGSRMLLWSKALGYQAGTERGKGEWAWWVSHLENLVSLHG